jgi:hypothetical protein
MSNVKVLTAVSTAERAKIQEFLTENYNMLGAHTYESAGQINLKLALYDGAGIALPWDELSDSERRGIRSTPGYVEDLNCFVFRRTDIEKYLEKVLGSSDIPEGGLDSLLYASSHTRYFLQHNDSRLFTPVLVDVAVDAEGYYTVTYTQESVGTFMVTLQKNKSGKSYVFRSNVKVD